MAIKLPIYDTVDEHRKKQETPAKVKLPVFTSVEKYRQQQEEERKRKIAALLSNPNAPAGMKVADYLAYLAQNGGMDASTKAAYDAEMEAKAADPKKQSQLAGALAIQKERELADYMASDERKQKAPVLPTVKTDSPMGDLGAFLGQSIVNKQQTGSFTGDEKEGTLRAEADYFQNLSGSLLAQDTMEKDMQILSTWSPQDKEDLETYLNHSDLAYGRTDMIGSAALDRLNKKFGRDLVAQVAESYSQHLNDQTAAEAEKLGKENHGLLDVAASIPLGWLGSITSTASQARQTVKDTLGLTTGRYKTNDTNTPGDLLSIYTGAVQQGAAEEAGEWAKAAAEVHGASKEVQEFAGKAASIAVQVGIGAADNLARVALTGGIGSLTLAATGSFSSAMREASQKGASPQQAMAMGFVSAASEVLTEKLPLDNLLANVGKGANLSNIGKLVTEAAKQAGIELATEEINLMAGLIAEAGILREKSGYRQTIADAVAGGMSYAEAAKQANRELLQQAGQTALQAGLSGFLTSGASSVISDADGSGRLPAAAENYRQQKADAFSYVQELLRRPAQETAQPATPSQIPAADVVEEILNKHDTQQTPAPEDPITALLKLAAQGKPVTNKQATGILNNPEAVQKLTQETGLDLDGLTASQKRNAVKDVIATLMSNRQSEPSAVDTAQNTGYDNKNTTGGTENGTEQEAPSLYGRGIAGTSGLQGAARPEDGNRPGIQSGVGEIFGGSSEIRASERGIDTRLEPFAASDYYTPEQNSELASAQRAFKDEYGLECRTVKASAWRRSSPAFIRNGTVYVSEGIDADTLKTLVPHESTHAMAQLHFEPYADFLIRTPEMIDLSRTETQELLSMVAEHCGIDIFSMDDSQQNKLFSELNATIYGMHKGGILSMPEYPYGNLAYAAFRDFDGYTTELDSIHNQYRAQAKAARNPTPTDGAVGAAERTDGYGENTVGSAQSRFRHEQRRSRVFDNTFANATDEGVRSAGQLAEAEDPGIANYEYVSEAESLHNAELRTRTARERGVEYTYLMKKDGWSGEDNDVAFRLLQDLQRKGDTQRHKALARKIREMGTTGGQLTQSFAKYSRTATKAAADAVCALEDMTPADVGKRFYIGRDDYRMTPSADASQRMDAMKQEETAAPHRRKDKDAFEKWKTSVSAAILDTANQIESVEDGDTESMKDIIRSLANFRHTTAWFGIRTNLTKAAEAALKDIDFQTAKDIATAQLSQIPGDFRKRSVGQVVKTLRIHNMLSALTTINRNLAGNATIGIMDATVDSTVGRALDALVSRSTKKRTVGNDVAHAKGYFEAAKKAAGMAALSAELDIPMESESRYSTGSTRTYTPQGGPVMRFLSAYEKYMKYALEVTDKFFEGGTNAAVDESLQALGAKANLTDKELREVSKMVGSRRTFKDDRMITRAAKGVKKGLNELGSDNLGLGDLAMPFAGTGSSVTQTAIDYSSGGLNGLVGILRIMKDAHNGKKIDAVRQRQAVTNAARGITGVGLIAGFAALAAAGVLKVHDDEDKDKRALEQSLNLSGAQLNVSAALRGISGESTDWQDGDYTVSVDFLEPFNAQMYVGYLLAQEDAIADIVKSYPKNAIRGVAQSVLDMPMMQGLADAQDLIEGLGESMQEGTADAAADALGQMIGNTASGFIPSWMRQTAQFIDPYYRDTTGDTALEKSVNQVKAAIPGLSQTLPKKYSGLGEEQLRYEEPVSGFFNTFVNPGDAAQIKADPVADYLGILSERTGNVSIYPESAAPGSFTYQDDEGEKHTVTVSGQEMTETYQKTYGDNVARLYSELIEDSTFLSLPDEAQLKALAAAKGYAAQLAKAAVSDYSEVPAYIRDKPSGMGDAEAILRQQLAGTTEKYTGLPIEKASFVDELLSGLWDKPREDKPDGGKYAGVRQIQQIEAVVAADKELTEKQQTLVLQDILDEKAFAKYEKVTDLGYDNDDFAEIYRLCLDTEGGKADTIRALMRQQGISYAAAKQLYEIYSPPRT